MGVGVGLADFAGEVTGQVTTDVSVYTGAGAAVVETVGTAALLADQLGELATTADPLDVHLPPLDECGSVVPGALPAPGTLPALVRVPPVGLASGDGVPSPATELRVPPAAVPVGAGCDPRSLSSAVPA